ncbi:MAG: hypothetical protein LUG21_05075 [Clostridiales bacterium]|nr:hypothetical protein [Clostridiales bacterium]
MDSIHFLSTGSSDCIIIESCGKIGMIDSAEDTEYPPNKPMCKLEGFEEEVCRYLVENFADENGTVNIEFVLGTHAHSDHIGGFDTVINHPQINVKKAFLKPYHKEKINIFERTQWDNEEVYTQMRDALINKNIPIETDFDNYSFYLGGFKLTFYNGTYKKTFLKYGENVNSVVTLAEIYNSKALLAGDMNYKCKGEKTTAPKVGKVDLLKVGHHCYEGSSSRFWLETLNPDIAVVTNSGKKMHNSVVKRIKKYSGAKIYPTVDNNGVKAVFTDKGIDIKTNIM